MSFTLQADRPSKNRVWDFLDDSFSYALKSSSQVVEAHQENSGVATTSASGVIKFSSKYHDNETDLIYYGFRYLNTDTGRWINRDPIGELGGVNLYGFVNNNSVSEYDVDGRWFDRFNSCRKIPKLAEKCRKGIEKVSVKSCKDALGFVKSGPDLFAEFQDMVDKEVGGCWSDYVDNLPEAPPQFRASVEVSGCAYGRGVGKFHDKYKDQLKSLEDCTCVKACRKLFKALKKCLSTNPLK